MSILRLGVWQMEGKKIRDLILNAIKFGYHYFKCAAVRYIRKKIIL
ncbi:NADP-dependent D-sorbitol-6-phosphate dehydrogenase [Linum grandiflorum]